MSACIAIDWASVLNVVAAGLAGIGGCVVFIFFAAVVLEMVDR